MKEKLEEIKTKGLEKIKNVKTIAELEEVRKELTGKKSELSEVLKSMKDLSVEEKKDNWNDGNRNKKYIFK